MFRYLILVLAALCVFFPDVSAQSIIRGKIFDKNGETLIGAAISLKEDQNIGTVTDFDGNYELSVPEGEALILSITYIGYQSIADTISIKKGEVLLKNYEMAEISTTLNEVVIVAKQERSNTNYMENIKKKAASTIDYVSAETMKKIGDTNVTTAVSRVSGVSTNGSFITVRGIGDRYVLTAINGSQIPTLDPFTNNIKLDIIPSSLVDNVIISKTASPDLPGDWTGAYISVETKDYPEKMSLNIETTVGYNQNSSFRDILANPTSSTDWLGYDNGFRDRNHGDFKNYKTDPTDYELFMMLGLDPFYKSLGVNNDWNGLTDQEVKENYYKLGLVELGLLPKALINDRQAVEDAKLKFASSGLRNQAFEKLNARAAQEGQSLPNNWLTYKKRASTNISQSFSFGNQTKLFGKTLGYILGGRYGQSIQYDPHSINQRTLTSLFNDGQPIINENSNPQIARYTNGWSALLNLAYKYSNNHSISILLMPNFLGSNNLREGDVFRAGADYSKIYGSNQFYEQRKQMIYQLRSEHFFPAYKLKMELNASYTNGESIVPDFKRFRFFEFDSTTYWYDPTAFFQDPLTRNFRYLLEDLLDSRIHFELPLSKSTSFVRKIKFGAAYKQLDKKYDQYNYDLGFDAGSSFATNKDLQQFFDLSHFQFKKDIFEESRLDYFYGNPDFAPNHTFGRSSILAFFVMADYNITKKLRVSGGLRYENTDQKIDSDAYDKLNLPRNDIRRIYQGALVSNPGILKSNDFLPSVNVIYKLKEDDKNPMNIRLNYSKTLARPSLREYSESIVFDNELRADVFGNANLKLVKVNNYDVRMETYFPSGDFVSLSLFYKDFKNHIELIDLNGGFSWSNSDFSTVKGIEIDGRKKLGKNIEFTTNISLISSKSTVIGYALMLDVPTKVQTWVPIDTFERVMYGQAPYVINTMVAYNYEKIGLNISLAYNLQGPRLAIQGARNVSDLSKNVPDIFEMPRHLFDLKIIQKLTERFGISLTVRDILNSPIRRSYKYTDSSGNNLGYLVDFDSFRYGTNFLLSFSYKI